MIFSMEQRHNLRAERSIIIIRESNTKRILCFGILALLAIGPCFATAAQTKGALVYGNLYRVHAGFLELSTAEKHVAVVKVDAATIYWDGKADKAALKKDMSLGDEIVAEMAEKDGTLVAKKVRFLHRGT